MYVNWYTSTLNVSYLTIPRWMLTERVFMITTSSVLAPTILALSPTTVSSMGYQGHLPVVCPRIPLWEEKQEYMEGDGRVRPPIASKFTFWKAFIIEG